MSQATDAAAIIAAINARFSTRRAYELTDPAVPTLTADHILVMVSRRYVPGHLISGEARARGGRVVTRYVATSAGNLRNLRDKTTAALENQFLPGDVGPFVFETSDASGPDGEWLVENDSWTY